MNDTATRAAADACAALAWESATDEDRTVIRCGMTPVTLLHHFDPIHEFTPRDITLALFRQADAHGGMIA